MMSGLDKNLHQTFGYFLQGQVFKIRILDISHVDVFVVGEINI